MYESEFVKPLKHIRDTLVKYDRRLKSFYTDEVIDSLAELLSSIKYGPRVVKLSVGKALSTIAKKVRKRQNISPELGILSKFSDVVVKTATITRKFTGVSYLVQIAVKLLGKEEALRTSRFNRVYITWIALIKLFSFIQLLSAVIAIHDLMSLSKSIDDIANEVMSS